MNPESPSTFNDMDIYCQVYVYIYSRQFDSNKIYVRDYRLFRIEKDRREDVQQPVQIYNTFPRECHTSGLRQPQGTPKHFVSCVKWWMTTSAAGNAQAFRQLCIVMNDYVSRRERPSISSAVYSDEWLRHNHWNIRWDEAFTIAVFHCVHRQMARHKN